MKTLEEAYKRIHVVEERFDDSPIEPPVIQVKRFDMSPSGIAESPEGQYCKWEDVVSFISKKKPVYQRHPTDTESGPDILDI